ncbi:MAG: transposase, partial [Oscillospiraceae bacterium]|nr:transposase [Oscillospiraceae bacterium]
MRYSNEFKLQCIEMYYQGKYPETPDGISATHFHDLIREWVRISERSSLNAVQHKAQSKKWTPEEKLELIEKVLAGGACR